MVKISIALHHDRHKQKKNNEWRRRHRAMGKNSTKRGEKKESVQLTNRATIQCVIKITSTKLARSLEIERKTSFLLVACFV